MKHLRLALTAALAFVSAVPLSVAADHATQQSDSSAVAARTLRRILLTNAVSAGSRLVAVGEQGYVIYSDDQAQTWKRAQTPPRNALLTAVAFPDAQHGWAVGHDGIVLASSDGGANWSEQRFEPKEEKPLLAVWFRDAQQGIAAGAYGLYIETHDGGKSWTPREAPSGDHHLNAIVPFGEGKLALVGESGTILVSPDQGTTWNAATAPYQGSFFGAQALPDKALLIYGLRGKAFRSEDGGKAWTAIENLGETSFFGSTALPGGAVVLAGASGALRLSTDGGKTFSAVPGATSTSSYTAVIPLDDKHLALFGENNTRALALGGAQ